MVVRVWRDEEHPPGAQWRPNTGHEGQPTAVYLPRIALSPQQADKAAIGRILRRPVGHDRPEMAAVCRLYHLSYEVD